MSTGRPVRPFRDRRDAGERLGRMLLGARDVSNPLVLGLPRGGVPVAAGVAEALEAPLDVVVVRKLGVPGFEELAMGAIASGGIRLLNEDLIRRQRISRSAVEAAVAREVVELARRERAYRGDLPPIDPAGRTAILVDDGLATGSTMRAAVAAVRERGPERVIAAVPVAPASTCRELEPLVDRLVCMIRASVFTAVGEWYEDFSQTSDDEVTSLLRRRATAGAGMR